MEVGGGDCRRGPVKGECMLGAKLGAAGRKLQNIWWGKRPHTLVKRWGVAQKIDCSHPTGKAQQTKAREAHVVPSRHGRSATVASPKSAPEEEVAWEMRCVSHWTALSETFTLEASHAFIGRK